MAAPAPMPSSRDRLKGLYVLLLVLGALTFLRLAYIQVLQHSHYVALAAQQQEHKYEVPAQRGQIYLYDGSTKVPLALDQTLKVIYADPSIISNKSATAAKLASATGQPASTYLKAMAAGSKDYAFLQGRVDTATAAKIAALNLYGIGMVDQDYRTYPEGSLASQVLGFVNDSGDGQYGIEGFLNKLLKGTPGELNARTGTNGVPIATSDNIDKPSTPGSDVVLTLDRNIQAEAETDIQQGVQNAKAASGSIIVLDPTTGAVKAMANYPTYDPNNYNQVTNYQAFENATVSNAFEPGSGFKLITMAAGLNEGKVTPSSTYTDTGCVTVTGTKICNDEQTNGTPNNDGPNTTMTNVLRDSLNTGVMYVLRLLGGDPNNITAAGKKLFYSYVTGRFHFGQQTGIEQTGEAAGTVNPPTSNDVNYANMTFGQGVTVTMLQMVDAIAAIANGGTLYRPYLVAATIHPDGSEQVARPVVVQKHVVSAQTSADMAAMGQVVVQHGTGYKAYTPGYQIAGKTGTAQVANANGIGYQANANIGSFIGYAPATAPKFVVMVRINEPTIPGDAEDTTVPVFATLVRWLFQYYAIPPSGQ
jgi:stage V sporulation protein D (sporulation-specific penicillin-binding protein)